MGFLVTLTGKCKMHHSSKLQNVGLWCKVNSVWCIVYVDLELQDSNSYGKIIIKQQQNVNRAIWMCVCLGQ